MKKFMYFAAALLVLVGCNKNSQTNKENAPQEIVTIKGGIVLPKTPNKIAAPTGWESATDPFTMLWEEGDKIYIYNEGDVANRQEFILTAGENSDYGTFAGTILPNMSAYQVVYGYDPSLDYKGEATYPTYPVPYIADNYRPFAEGAGAEYEFNIANFGPVIGLQLKGDGAFSKIEVALSNSSKETLATYTMTFAEALTLSAESVTKVYFPIQAKEGAVKIAISFYKKVNSEEVLTLTKTTNMPEANKVTTFPVLTFQSAYEYVDLGLPSGVKWATCNVGATAPEGNGDYFAWGETAPYYNTPIADPITWKEGKTGYNWASYFDTNDGGSTFQKYYLSGGKTTLDLEDDAANVNWGGAWRMPTKTEYEELINTENCEWVWQEDYNSTGVKGHLVTSKHNGNSIFLPASGYRDGSSLISVGSNGFYWSSSLSENHSFDAYHLDFGSDEEGCFDNNRDDGRSVRPVYKIVYK